jgi:hypothetical protein
MPDRLGQLRRSRIPRTQLIQTAVKVHSGRSADTRDFSGEILENCWVFQQFQLVEQKIGSDILLVDILAVC